MPDDPTGSDLDYLDPLYDVIKSREELGMFQQVLYAASFKENAGDDIVRILRREKNFTVFAPTNDTIPKEKWDEIESLIKDQESDATRKKLRQIAGRHIVRGKFTTAEIEQRVGKPFQTLYGTPLLVTTLVTTGKKEVLLNNTRLQKRDVYLANNGILSLCDGFINA